MEPAVDEIVFTRMPEKNMMERSFVEKFAGEYVIGDVIVTVSLKGENTLVLLVTGQPEYELVPYRGTEFNLKNLTGYNVEFILDESGIVIEAKIKQPEGVFTAKKKEAQAKGIAESDPSLDVEGLDTASKIILIANAVLDKDFTLNDVKVEGIAAIPPRLLRQGMEKGKALKLLACSGNRPCILSLRLWNDRLGLIDVILFF